MEACPVCGEQRRNSARFCTTCGHRFATDEIVNAPVPPVTPDATTETGANDDPLISGWPAPAPPAAASPWAPPTGGAGGWPAPPPAANEPDDSTDVTWADVAATAFGTPRKAPPAAIPETDVVDVVEFDVIDDRDPDAATSAAQNDDALRQRARDLMSELREVIDSLTNSSSTAGDELASDLQISLTRPAALEGEALAALRAAAESAQERPRDLDTLTALTAQADAILALIVAYERASAGIERAIEDIRRQESTRLS